MMSSMTRVALIAPLLLTSAAAVAMQPAPPPASSVYQAQPAPAYQAPMVQTVPSYAPAYAQSYATRSIDAAIADWRRLRQSDSYPFASYASFLASYPGFPGQGGLRKSAERAMRPGESPWQVIGFYRADKPVSGNGWARLADAYAATNRPADALAAARSALASSDLSAFDEATLLTRFAAQLTPADRDARIDVLLFDKKTSDALRLSGMASPARRAAFLARIAMQQRAPDADAQYAAVAGQVTGDAGLMMDRARFLRDAGYELAARQLAARSHAFTIRPASVERFYDMMVILAGGAVADRQWQTAFDIARQLDDSFAPGTDVSRQPYAVRDDYTTLAWLAGSSALQLNRAASAMTMFDKYAHGGQSLQVFAKGKYWAGRAALQAALPTEAMRYFEAAAATPELFYGQLALERLGRPVPPPATPPSLLVSDAQRRAFHARPLVAAIRQLGAQGNRSDQALFVRALAESLDSNSERILACELGTAIGRPDLGVWTARAARNSGSAFYYRPAYPIHGFAASSGRLWALIHGITRQESSFDRSVISHANAQGMMQIVPRTGREQADKMGIAFDSGRLTSDPAFNVMIGTAYFQRLLDTWGGSYPLAVASYNAGPGNVRKWINLYGDPRNPGVDMIGWIERIPFEETRGYVQRVLENSVVYDTINPTAPATGAVHLSSYLGKSNRPG
ncbi:MAG: lytic transglycosylase domain-containing protein [Sphingomicrobium sp.]